MIVLIDIWPSSLGLDMARDFFQPFFIYGDGQKYIFISDVGSSTQRLDRNWLMLRSPGFDRFLFAFLYLFYFVNYFLLFTFKFFKQNVRLSDVENVTINKFLLKVMQKCLNGK